jgi:broad specificity phosphatase PhoE
VGHSQQMAITRLYLVRHGATQLSVEDRFLSEEGRSQAERLAARMRDDGISAIYSSPLSRAVETARIIARGCGLEPTSSDRTA